ncbi:MAG TPA: hypothetical protein ENN69_05025 [Spirochaetia bacterium]|nr:hypothetical protein [Spirochaetia bacterium]
MGLCMFTAALVSCSDNPPEIIETEWQVIVFQNRLLGATYQRLSLFVRGGDEDGEKDLQALHLIQDEEELYWTVKAESWEKSTIRGSDWYGSNGFVMPGGGKLPLGAYRVLLEDLSGKMAESRIYLKRENVDTEGAVFPSPLLQGSTITIGGNFVDPEIWVYDTNDQFLFRIPLPERSITVENIIGRNNVLTAGFTYYLYGKQSGKYYGALNGPYYYSAN